MSEPKQPVLKPEAGDKPVRVMEREVVVGRCPLCTKPLLASVEIEVRLGELEVGETVDEETGEITANISALTRLRKLKIEHECQAPVVKPRTRKPRTPRAAAVPPEPPADEPPIPIDLLPPPDSPVWTGEPDPESGEEETNDEEKEMSTS